MQKIYTIIKEGITIGHFQDEKDRDEAFEEYVLPYSSNCLKGEK